MNKKQYKTKKGTYSLPAVYYTDKHGYFSVDEPTKNGKIKCYLPKQDTSKTVNIDALDKVAIIREENPLDLKINDIYNIAAGSQKLSFTVASVEDNKLILKCTGTGKNTQITNEFSVVSFSAFIKQLQKEGYSVNVTAANTNESNNKSIWIIGGIVGIGVVTYLITKKKNE
ncbi:MAG: hypothetical protein IJ150_03670 [Bacteroidales bacterium]|nr:hypothetical protein [Bacteroidales bacterium]